MKIEGNRFLLVEDEPIIGFALEDMMQDRGAETAFASDSDSAMKIIAEQKFDGAILDVNLHGTHSYDVARMLLDRGVTLIFATGYGDKAHPEEFANVPTIPKPYSIESIVRAFEEA